MPLDSSSVLERSEETPVKPVRKEWPQSLSLLREETPQSRRRSFAAGFIFQILLMLVLIRVAAYTPKLLLEKPHETVVLIAPRLEETPPPPKPHLVAPKLSKPLVQPTPPPTPKIEPPAVTPPPVEAKVEPPKVQTPEPPKPVRHVEVNTFASAAPTPQPPAPPKPEVKTDVFAGSSAKPTIKAPVQEVQTGGFGNPVGAKGSTTESAKLNAPKLGGFDMPTGPGNGNGTGGSHGRPGVVASAGFGSGVAANGTHDVPGGGVHQGGFIGAQTASASTTGAAPTAPAMTPVQILEKPQPVYTKEARDLKIEGEVHLKVLFQADGRVEVLQVVQGLGHGLDEAAKNAAQKIRFKPAQRDGRPCDMTATVHILFQLAS